MSAFMWSLLRMALNTTECEEMVKRHSLMESMGIFFLTLCGIPLALISVSPPSIVIAYVLLFKPTNERIRFPGTSSFK